MIILKGITKKTINVRSHDSSNYYDIALRNEGELRIMTMLTTLTSILKTKGKFTT